MFKVVLAAYDGSDHAKRAVDAACDIAKHYDAQLILAHAPQPETHAVAAGAFVSNLADTPTDKEIAEAGEKMMAQAKSQAEAAGVQSIRCEICKGAPEHALTTLAQDAGADLIVLGRRGLGSIKSLALGSVSQKVAHNTPCACMTVH